MQLTEARGEPPERSWTALDVIIEIIIWIARALLGVDDSKKPRTSNPPVAQAAPVRGRQAAMQAPAQQVRPRPQPMSSPAQDPAYDDGGWRTAVVVLGVLVLIALAAAWYLATRGLLPAG